jgi:WD40 repeat protein
MKIKSLFLLSCLCTSVLAQQNTLETVIQKGHDQAILAVEVTPDSNFAATGSRDKTMKLWELSTGREVRTFLGHTGTVNNIRFSTKGNYAITSSGDGTAKIWEVISGKVIFTTPTSPSFLSSVSLSPDEKHFVASGYEDHAVIYNFNTKQPVKKLDVNSDKGTKYGTNVLFSPDGKWLAIGEDNRAVSVYNSNDWEKAYALNEENSSCGGCPTWIQYSSASDFIFKASNKGPVKQYSLKDGKVVRTFSESVEDIGGFVISPDNRQLVIVSKQGEIMTWNVTTGKETKSKTVDFTTEVNDVAFTRDGKKLLLACDDNGVRIYDIEKQKMSGELAGILSHPDKGGLNYDINSYWESHIAKYLRFKNNLLLTDGGKSLTKGKFGTKVKRWDIATGKTLMEYSKHTQAVICQTLSKDGKTLVTGGGDGKIIFWNLEDGDTLRSISAHREVIFDVQFNKSETVLMSSSWDGTVRFWDTKTGKSISTLNLQNASAYSLAFSNNGLYVFAAQLDETLKMWETDTKKVVREFIGHTGVIAGISVDATGNRLLSWGWDGTIRLWDIATGLMTQKFSGHTGAVYAAMFSPDGQHIYSGGADRSIRMWSIQSAQIVKTFDGHLADVTSLQITEDNKLLVSHGIDGVTKFWDLTNGKEFYEHIHLGDHDWMVKTPEGYFNGTAGARESIHYVSGLKTYSVDQFFEEYYRPELLPKIFKARGNIDEENNLQGRLNNSPPPKVQVAVIPTQSPGEADVFVKITNNGGGAKGLKLFHNGKNIPVDFKTLKFPQKKDENTVYKQTIRLTSGNNIFSATANNHTKVESNTASAEYFSDHVTKSGTCYIVSIGINQYKNSKMTLNYAKPDADSFSKIMEGNTSDLFREVKVYNLYDTQASRENILKLMDDLGETIGSEDVFIFFYAGHGSMVENQFFFVPSEGVKLYDLKALQKDAIPAEILQEKFQNIKALKQLIIMDACQSGASVELLATRGSNEEKAIAQLSRSAGIHVMASAGSQQFATEFAELGHGLFTYVLMQALAGDADGAPKDGKVTIYELKSYLDDQVPEMTQKMKGKPQYPYTFSKGQDFPLILKK